MVVAQGEIWWADLADPIGSSPGYRRPVVVVQCDSFNRSSISTVVCVAITSNLRLALAPGNVTIPIKHSGLDKESVANVTALVTVDRSQLTERIGKLSNKQLDLVVQGINLVLGR